MRNHSGLRLTALPIGCRSTLPLAALVMSLALGASPAIAADTSAERMTLSAGAYSVIRYDSSAMLTTQGSGLGAAFNPENVLGLDSTQTVFQLNASYHFNRRHSLVFSWFRISTSNRLVLEDEIEWIDDNGDPVTIPIGVSLSSGLNYEITKIGYLWRFYESDKVSLSAGIGLHTTEVELNLRAELSTSDISASRADTSLPLPVFSFGVDYAVTPRFGWFMKAEVFALSFDDISGTYDDVQLGMEYRLWDKVGVGVALGNNALRSVETGGDARFEYENRITGALFYLKGYF